MEKHHLMIKKKEKQLNNYILKKYAIIFSKLIKRIILKPLRSQKNQQSLNWSQSLTNVIQPSIPFYTSKSKQQQQISYNFSKNWNPLVILTPRLLTNMYNIVFKEVFLHYTIFLKLKNIQKPLPTYFSIQMAEAVPSITYSCVFTGFITKKFFHKFTACIQREWCHRVKPIPMHCSGKQNLDHSTALSTAST